MPSPSVSNHSVSSVGKASIASQTSTIVTGPSQKPSPSVSGFNESVAGSDDVSSSSFRRSPSSSLSKLLPIPSPSVSNHSEGSNGKASGPASQIRTSLIVTETEPSQ